MTSRYEQIRELHRPEQAGVSTKVLMVGESRPDGGTFFYCGDSKLYYHTWEAFRQAYGSAVSTGSDEFLRQFQRNGFFLIDLCDKPVNKMADIPRDNERVAGEKRIASELKRMPFGVRLLPVMIAIEGHVTSSLDNAGRADIIPHPSLPFPSRPNHAERYVRELSDFLRIHCSFEP